MKVAFDRSVALLLLVGLAPLIALVAILVRASSRGPVIFRQERPGLGGELFPLLKFRTMTDARSRDGELLPDADRLTRVGRFLRSTSLDELPQLWNVLRGDLSLVGPRPLLTEYLDKYRPDQARRHEALPGVTGWAQVNGRNALSWPEKFALDVWYVDNWSLALDARILLQTIRCTLRREGIARAGHVTMPVWEGNEIGTPSLSGSVGIDVHSRDTRPAT